MKRILAALALALAAATSFGATLNPIQLLSPVGSTAGQAIISTGAATAPTWGTAGAGLFAPLASPAFTGVPTAPSAGAGSSTSQIATTAFVYGTFAAPTIGVCSTTACAGSFTGITTNTLSTFSNTTAGASIIKFIGNGATTPNKFMGVLGGIFTIFNSGGGSQLMGLTDAGNLSILGSIQPSSTGGIVGTVTNDNANAGSVGEFITATTASTALTSGAVANTATMAVAAGDYQVEGTVQISPTASTALTTIIVGISTTSGVRPTNFYQETVSQLAFGANAQVVSTPSVRIPMASAGTIYLTVLVIYTGGTGVTAAPGWLSARRAR